MGKLDRPVLEILQNSPEPLTLAEIAQKLDKPEKTIFRTLKRLFEKGKINTRGRQYTIAKE
ncbi:MAG: winged helix-turn-helix transcriptional regulator [Candidatus Bathyarchaeota archaeon]|nr:winged helix-turn-helix transcriptional regulator [Candidatus Bathyarchaeota archaeon]